VLASVPASRGDRWRFAIAYVLTSTLGGIVVATVIGLLGQVVGFFLPLAFREVVFLLLLGVGVAAEVTGHGHQRTGFVVPAAWITGGGPRAACVWGTILGLGFLTQTRTLILLYLAGAILVGSWWQGVLAGTLFGFCRAAFPLVDPIRWGILQADSCRRGRSTQLALLSRGLSLAALGLAIVLVARP